MSSITQDLTPRKFSFGENPIRVFVGDDGNPWWMAADVCAVLDLGNSRQALTRLDDDEKGVISTDTPGGRQEVSTINESGLYSLVLGSRKPEAKAFKKWITSEVIPSIRKTGSYGAALNPANMTRLQLITMALESELMGEAV